MASEVKLFRRLVTSNRRSFCLHKDASSCALKPALPIQNHHCHPGLTINTLQRHRVFFQRHSTNSSQEAVIHNRGLISDWHTRESTEACLLLRLRPGDLVEFDREVYCHWAVYVGRFGEEGHCVVHRANPTGEGSIELSSASLGSGDNGDGGRVLIEPLGSVWASSPARINNSRDVQLPPFHSKQVVQRALSSVEGLDRGSAAGGGGGYNVVTNNCEHFASWARNDWALSGQVVKAASKLVQLGVGIAKFKVRPIFLVGMVAAEGLKVITKKSTKSTPSSVADKDGLR